MSVDLQPLTDEQVHELARRIVTNEVFVALNADALDCAFGMILALGSDHIAGIVNDVGFVYEEISKASPMGVNGYPTFLSCKFVHKDSAEAVFAKVREFDAVLNPKQASEEEKEKKE